MRLVVIATAAAIRLGRPTAPRTFLRRQGQCTRRQKAALREPPSHVLYQIVLASLLHAPDGGFYELGVGARVIAAREEQP